MTSRRAINLNELDAKQTEVTATKSEFSYTVKKIPQKVKDDFDRLKTEGKVFGSMNAFFLKAVTEQLKRDASQ